MNRSENLYMAETGKSVGRFVADFSAVVKANQFVINNPASMDMAVRSPLSSICT